MGDILAGTKNWYRLLAKVALQLSADTATQLWRSVRLRLVTHNSSPWLRLVGGGLLSAWFIMGYILSGTVFETVSARRFIPFLNDPISWASQWMLSAVVICVWYSLKPSPSHSVWRSLFWYLVLVCLGACIMSAVRFGALPNAGATCGLLLAPLFCGLLAARLSLSTVSALSLMCILTGVEAIYSICYYVSGVGHFYSGDIMRAVGTYGQPSALYRILTASLPISVALLLVRANTWNRILWACVICLVTIALTLTWYRISAVAVSLSIYWLLAKIGVRLPVSAAIAVLMVTLVVVVIQMRIRDPVDEVSSHGSFASHTLLWEEGWRVFVDHPITGVGISRLELPVRIKLYANKTFLAKLPGAHNQFITVLAETGIAGFIIMIGLCTVVTIVLLSDRHVISLGLLSSWVALMICGFTDTVFGIGTPEYGPVNVATGLMLGVVLRRREHSPNRDIAR